jgi:hypothetical protein
LVGASTIRVSPSSWSLVSLAAGHSALLSV